MLRTLLATFCISLCVFAQDKKPTTYELPKDKNAVVLTLDYQNGYTPIRQTSRPFFAIHADGTMVACDVYDEKLATLKGSIKTSELQELLRFVIEKQKFCDWDAAKLKKQFAARKKAGREVGRIEDAADTVVKLDIPGRKKKAQVNALSFVVKEAPEIAQLQRLHAVASKLHRMLSTLRVGGKEKLKAHLKLVNLELKKKWPKEKPLKEEDLNHARILSNGHIRMSFIRPKTKKTSIYVSIEVSKKGKPSFRLQEIDSH